MALAMFEVMLTAIVGFIFGGSLHNLCTCACLCHSESILGSKLLGLVCDFCSLSKGLAFHHDNARYQHQTTPLGPDHLTPNSFGMFSKVNVHVDLASQMASLQGSAGPLTMWVTDV